SRSARGEATLFHGCGGFFFVLGGSDVPFPVREDFFPPFLYEVVLLIFFAVFFLLLLFYFRSTAAPGLSFKTFADAAYHVPRTCAISIGAHISESVGNGGRYPRVEHSLQAGADFGCGCVSAELGIRECRALRRYVDCGVDDRFWIQWLPASTPQKRANLCIPGTRSHGRRCLNVRCARRIHVDAGQLAGRSCGFCVGCAVAARGSTTCTSRTGRNCPGRRVGRVPVVGDVSECLAGLGGWLLRVSEIW